MAVVVTIEAPGMTQEQAESIAQQAGTATQLALGQLFRAWGPIAGGWQVIAGFESVEVFQSYFRDRLQPGFQRLGTQPSRVQVWQVADVQTAS